MGINQEDEQKLGYKNNGGFNSLCSEIKFDKKMLSKSKTHSMFWIAFLFYDHSSFAPLFDNEFLEDTCNEMKICLKEKNPAAFREILDGLNQTDSTNRRYLLNKGHVTVKSKEVIKTTKKSRSFLSALAQFLVKGTGINSYIDYTNFNMIKENLIRALNIFYDNNYVLNDSDNVFHFLLDDHPDWLEQAYPFKTKLNELRIRDPYTALTWMLIFSLYPDIENDDLKSVILGPFGKGYMDDVFIPLSLDIGMPSYKEQLIAASEYGNENTVYNKYETFLSSDETIGNGRNRKERLMYVHLALLESYESFFSNKNNYDKLGEILAKIDKAVKKIGDSIALDDDLFLEKTQLLLLKADIHWRRSEYEAMKDLLYSIEEMLYLRSIFTDQYIELYAITKRKLGIYFGRMMYFREALSSYHAAYFAVDAQKEYEHSKIWNNEGVIYRKWYRFDMAQKRYEDALRSREERISYDPDSIYMVASNISITLGIIHDFKKAKEKSEFACVNRKELIDSDNRFWLLYIISSIYYASIYTLSGLCSENEERKEDWEIAKQKFFELSRELSNKYTINTSNFHVKISYCLQYGAFLFFSGNTISAKQKFEKAKETYILYQEENACLRSSDRILATIYLYAGKTLYADGETDTALQYIKNAFKIGKSLYKESIDKSYFRYAYMICCFHLGAILILINSYDKETKAKKLILEAKKNIEKLMTHSPNAPVTYRENNNKAFSREYKIINEFIHTYDKIKEKDIFSDEDIEPLKNLFLDFYIIMDGDE